MSLDKEVLKIDSFGVFPRPGETIEGYVSRGWKIVQHTDCKDPLDHILPILKFCEWKNISPVEKNMVRDAAARLSSRFCCDMGWIDAYYAETDFPQEKSTLGFSQANKKSIEKGVEKQIPPFVVLNRRSMIPHMPTLLHEMAHSAREMSDVNPHKGPDYVGDYEEIVADSAGNIWNQLVHWRLLFSKALPIYISARSAMQTAFGDMADYVMIRTPFEEINKYYTCCSRQEKDPKEVICLAAEEGIAEKPSLRHMIMKERLGL